LIYFEFNIIQHGRSSRWYKILLGSASRTVMINFKVSCR